MSPRIDLVAPPFSGHLHPILGIARRLAREHAVRVVSTEEVQGQIAAAGLAGVALLPGRDGEIRAIAEPDHAVGHHPLRLHAQRLIAHIDACLALGLDPYAAEPTP